MTFRVHQQQSSASSLNKHFAERKRFYARALSLSLRFIWLSFASQPARPHFSALEGLIVGLEVERASGAFTQPIGAKCGGNWGLAAESGIHSNSLLASNSHERGHIKFFPFTALIVNVNFIFHLLLSLMSQAEVIIFVSLDL
jgi:hypothetical protein